MTVHDLQTTLIQHHLHCQPHVVGKGVGEVDSSPFAGQAPPTAVIIDAHQGGSDPLALHVERRPFLAVGEAAPADPETVHLHDESLFRGALPSPTGAQVVVGAVGVALQIQLHAIGLYDGQPDNPTQQGPGVDLCVEATSSTGLGSRSDTTNHHLLELHRHRHHAPVELADLDGTLEQGLQLTFDLASRAVPGPGAIAHQQQGYHHGEGAPDNGTQDPAAKDAEDPWDYPPQPSFSRSPS